VPVSTDAYRALAGRLRELEGAVFSEREAQQLREAADARLFGDSDQMDAVTAALEMLDALVGAARLSTRTRGRLADLLCEIEPVRGGS
jgi:hypothetical protein